MRRALLIASQIFGLTGCEDDAALMLEVLGARGFGDTTLLAGAGATRAAIVDAFERLIERVGPDDAVVVYYSGHGGRIPYPDWQQRQEAGCEAFVQYIVPTDMEQTTAGNFRGVLGAELSRWQLWLTERTRNVTTILDCCHSGLMARDPALTPKAVTRAFPAEGAFEQLEVLEGRGAGGPAPAAPFGDGNPNVVRVVACAPNQSAFEGPSRLHPGRRHGLLTEALVELLTGTSAANTTVSWRTLGGRLRTVVSSAALMQRPEIEGPASRLVFDVDTELTAGALPVRVAGGRVYIEAASLFRVAAGDRYGLTQANGRRVAEAVAGAPAGGRAELSVVQVDAAVDVDAVLAAVPLRSTSRLLVAVGDELPAALREQVLSAIEGSAVLSVPGPLERPIASLEFAAGLIVRDGAGAPLHAGTIAPDAAGVAQAVRVLARAARAERFRELQSGTGGEHLKQSLSVTLRRHSGGHREGPAPVATLVRGTGERLFAGDRVSVTVRNLSTSALYFWLFDVGTSGEIRLVTDASPSGRELAPVGQPGDTQTVGGPDGVPLEWPAELPAEGGRPETFVVIVADRAQDLRGLGERDSARAAEQPPSPLRALLAEAHSGVRDWAAEASAAPSIRYRVESFDVILEPRSRDSIEEPEFALDERPDLSVRMLAPRAAVEVHAKVAVRLVALSVRKNRALLRATVRLDALVITADADGRAVGLPFTQRFPGIADGDLLPMMNLLLYAGGVREFLDLAVWVNRDDDKGATLADMFDEEVNKPELKDALTVVSGLVLAAPSVAAGVGAVVAVAELVRVGARLVSVAVGKHIGLYRTSLLPHERFGVGRHPAAGLQEAQDIGFAFEVVEQP